MRIGSRLAGMVALLAMLSPSPAARAAADPPQVRRQQDQPATTVSPGVLLRELIGRGPSAVDPRSQLLSVAWFRLEPGRSSAWSHNKQGEEAFLVLTGHGTVWTGSQAQAIGPGSYVLVQPATVRSVRADRGEPVTFYAITAPAWSRSDDVLVQPPPGAKR